MATIITATPTHGAHSYKSTFIRDLMLEGPRRDNWLENPHQLIYDACCEIARLEAEIKRLNELNA